MPPGNRPRFVMRWWPSDSITGSLRDRCRAPERKYRNARPSLSVGFLAAIVNLTAGLSLALTAAFYGGRVDDLITWLVNTVRSIPGLFLLLIVAAIFRVGPAGLAIIIGLTSWTGGARLVRGQALQIREAEYISAARSLGASNRRLVLLHLLPQCASCCHRPARHRRGRGHLARVRLELSRAWHPAARCELGQHAE